MTHKRLIEVLFAEGRREVIKEEDIPFQGWTSTDIVMLLLDEVLNEVSCSAMLSSLWSSI